MMKLTRTFTLPRLRNWSTPLTIGSFILMSATGILMFFEQESLGIITIVHQWFSWLFLLGSAGHIAANFYPFKKHLKTPWGKITALSFISVFVLSLFSWGLVTGPQLERPIELALVDAPLSALADVIRMPQANLIEKLKSQGISATPQHSIRDVVEQTQIDENILLGIIFLAE